MQLRSWQLPAAVTALMVTIFASIAFHASDHRALVDAQHAVDAAHQQTQAALEQSHTSLARAQTAELAADAQHEAASAAQTRADSLARVAAVLRERFTDRVAAAPDTCHVVVASADTALDAAEIVADTLQTALSRAQEAARGYKTAADSSQAALSRLTAAAGHLDTASVALRDAARPSFFHRILPRIGFGVGTGVNPQGHFDAVAGLTLGWAF